MVTLEEIRIKAELLYPRAIRAWLNGDGTFFPAQLKVSTARDADTNIARQAQHTLIEHSNARGTTSYSLRFRKRKSRLHGEQNFISGVCFDTMPDLVGFLGKQSEFDVFRSNSSMMNWWPIIVAVPNQFGLNKNEYHANSWLSI